MLFQQRCIFNEINKSAFLLFTFVRDARAAREEWNFPLMKCLFGYVEMLMD